MGDSMNQETQRNFIIKLITASIVCGGVWFSMVGPKLTELDELAQVLESQSEEVSVGEKLIQQHSQQVGQTVLKMQDIRNDIGKQLDVMNEVNVHKHIQDAAEARGLTVSRIEPLRVTINKRMSSVDQKEVKIQTREFRIECVGAFGSTIAYLDDLNRSVNLSKVSMFRIVPVSSEYARMILQVEVYQLIDAPEMFGESSETLTTLFANTGDMNDDA